MHTKLSKKKLNLYCLRSKTLFFISRLYDFIKLSQTPYFSKTACCEFYWYSNFQRSAKNSTNAENYVKIHLKSYKIVWFAFIFFFFSQFADFFAIQLQCPLCDLLCCKKNLYCVSKKTFTGRKGSCLTGSCSQRGLNRWRKFWIFKSPLKVILLHTQY